MGSKKTKTTVENKAPQFVEQPKSPYYAAAKANLDNLDFTTPVNQAFGRASNLIRESGNDFFGANTSAEMAGKVRDNRLFRNEIDKGLALSNAKQNEINSKMTGNMTLGQATAPIVWNPGGTTTQVQPFDWAGTLIGGANAAANVGTAAA